MQKTEIINELSARTELSKQTCEKVLAAFMELTQETLNKKEKIQLKGFGTFSTKHLNERETRNPSTGEVKLSPAKDKPSFKPSNKWVIE